MRINFAHVRERAAAGGYVDFAVFDARSSSGSDADNATLLHQLTVAARLLGLKIDQSVLAYNEAGRVRVYGAKTLVDYLARVPFPQWTSFVDV